MQGDFGDISDRIKLRENLGCKSFKWFLTEIYSELFIPGEALAHGEVSALTALMAKKSDREADILLLFADPKSWTGRKYLPGFCSDQEANE